MGLIPYISSMNDTVVYFHKRNDTNEVFYVGIGTPKRPKAKDNRNTYWSNVVNKVGYTIEIVHEGLTWDEACEYETKYIKDFGRKDLGLGLLVNMTDGGDGSVGFKHSEETKKKMIKNRITSHREESKKKISENNACYWKGKTMSKEHRIKLSKSAHMRKLTTEQVIEIRNRYSQGNIFQRELAEEYNISRGQIGKIIRKERNTLLTI